MRRSKKAAEEEIDLLGAVFNLPTRRSVEKAERAARRSQVKVVPSDDQDDEQPQPQARPQKQLPSQPQEKPQSQPSQKQRRKSVKKWPEQDLAAPIPLPIPVAPQGGGLIAQHLRSIQADMDAKQALLSSDPTNHSLQNDLSLLQSRLNAVLDAKCCPKPARARHHLCSGCGAVRSAKFHEKHPLGDKPVLNYCLSCQDRGGCHFCFMCGIVRSREYHRKGGSVGEVNYCGKCTFETQSEASESSRSSKSGSSRGRHSASSPFYPDRSSRSRRSPLPQYRAPYVEDAQSADGEYEVPGYSRGAFASPPRTSKGAFHRDASNAFDANDTSNPFYSQDSNNSNAQDGPFSCETRSAHAHGTEPDSAYTGSYAENDSNAHTHSPSSSYASSFSSPKSTSAATFPVSLPGENPYYAPRSQKEDPYLIPKSRSENPYYVPRKPTPKVSSGFARRWFRTASWVPEPIVEEPRSPVLSPKRAMLLEFHSLSDSDDSLDISDLRILDSDSE